MFLDLRVAKNLYITLAGAFTSLILFFYLYHIVKSGALGSLSLNFVFPYTSDTHNNTETTLEHQAQEQPLDTHNYDLEFVVASLKEQDTSWYTKYFPEWKFNIYIVDDPAAPLTVPQNKGHEAMVYLTYIIDRYDTLPNKIVFLHAERFQWHNDNPDYDGVQLLQNFQFAYLEEEGYVNLRCVWVLGCPAELHPLEDAATGEQHKDQATGEIFRQAFGELLKDEPVPTEIGVSCCAQFAVTKNTIQHRSRDDYVRFREWLLATPFQDELSGRFFEYSWHIIFGKAPVYCPSAKDCYCKVYGMCDLPNCSIDGCKGHYTLPAYSTLPEGWPRKGWNGEDRPFSGPP